MRKIPLTRGLYAIVDDEDSVLVSKYKWCADWCKKTKSYYAKTSISINSKSNRTVRMHRFVLQPIPDGLVVDHINHDTLDNRKSNLRLVTVQLNNINKRNTRKLPMYLHFIESRGVYVVRKKVIGKLKCFYYGYSVEEAKLCANKLLSDTLNTR